MRTGGRGSKIPKILRTSYMDGPLADACPSLTGGRKSRAKAHFVSTVESRGGENNFTSLPLPFPLPIQNVIASEIKCSTVAWRCSKFQIIWHQNPFLMLQSMITTLKGIDTFWYLFPFLSRDLYKFTVLCDVCAFAKPNTALSNKILKANLRKRTKLDQISIRIAWEKCFEV